MNAPLKPLALRAERQRSFQTFDGATLFFRHWPDGVAKHNLVLLHRGHEHSGRMDHLARELALRETAVYALDTRGHGQSGGETAPSVAVLARDLECFMLHLADVDGAPAESFAILAQSVGAVVAAAWVHDYAPPIRGMSLGAPAFDIDLRFPLARQTLSTALALGARPTVRSRVTAKELTQDEDRRRSYEADPLITPKISADLLIDLRRTSDRLIADAQAITVPTQILTAGDDRVVRCEASEQFAEALGSARKESHLFPGLRHDLLGERDRAPVIDATRRFLKDCFERPEPAPDLTDADRRGFTQQETEALKQPLPLWSSRGAYWRGLRVGTKLGALISSGLAIGVKIGFDSGATLDYVYRNEATGTGPLGRLLDRSYLKAIGWRGIRQRKRHLEELIEVALSRLEAAGATTNVVDIAAGHGRYVLDALIAREHLPDSVLLRDYCARNVAAGREMIAEHGLTETARFELGDAFDRAALAAMRPSPDLAIVSGLYELFPENAAVRTSLAGLAEAVASGGYLIYTGQPWHPQLEQIARTLNSHRGGQDWVMRRRTQLEMDQLVREAGFEKIEQRIDRWGIFTVSLARRIG
ncbi:MAG: bifunctional alpha/beta hydrolase/class I SAM-dependent methyltransferase [Pseudomonadota bacterium]